MNDRNQATRRHLAGPFLAQDLGQGFWHFTAQPAGPEIFLRGVAPDTLEKLANESLDSLTVEWGSDCVEVAVSARGRVLSLLAASAMIHEPSDGLYEALPLAQFDARAERFWRRIFLLMRLPGGRFLLRMFTGRARPARAKK